MRIITSFMTLFMPDQFIFLQFALRYSPLFSLDLPELQIDDILRYLSEDDNEESAASLPHLMYQPHHLSHRLHRPVLLHSTRGWQPPLKDSLDLLKAILHYYNHHTYTKRVTRDGRHAWRVRMCFDDGLPMMFNHNISGTACRGKTTFHHSSKS